MRELTHYRHKVLVQCGAVAAIDLTDAQYKAAGSTLTTTAAEVFAAAGMIVKVKGPQPAKCAMLRPGKSWTATSTWPQTQMKTLR